MCAGQLHYGLESYPLQGVPNDSQKYLGYLMYSLLHLEIKDYIEITLFQLEVEAQTESRDKMV